MADYTQIIQEINTNLPNNNTQAITAAKLRTTLIDFVNQVDSNEDNIETTLQGKQDSLTFDSAPIENSVNPVTSGGIYDALQNIDGTFYSGQEVGSVSIVNDLSTGGISNVLSAEQGVVLAGQVSQVEQNVDYLQDGLYGAMVEIELPTADWMTQLSSTAWGSDTDAIYFDSRNVIDAQHKIKKFKLNCINNGTMRVYFLKKSDYSVVTYKEVNINGTGVQTYELTLEDEYYDNGEMIVGIYSSFIWGSISGTGVGTYAYKKKISTGEVVNVSNRAWLYGIVIETHQNGDIDGIQDDILQLQINDVDIYSKIEDINGLFYETKILPSDTWLNGTFSTSGGGSAAHAFTDTRTIIPAGATLDRVRMKASQSKPLTVYLLRASDYAILASTTKTVNTGINDITPSFDASLFSVPTYIALSSADSPIAMRSTLSSGETSYTIKITLESGSATASTYAIALEVEYTAIKGNNISDDLAEAIAQGGNDIVLGPYDYAVTTPITLTSGMTIRGSFGKTRLILSDGCTTAITASNATDIKISDLEIVGTCPNYSYEMNGIVAGNGYTLVETEENAIALDYMGTEKGIYLYYCENVVLENLKINHITGSAIRVNHTGMNYIKGLNACNLFITNCYNGIYCENEHEFSQYTNWTITLCMIGVYVESGNLIFTAGHATRCRVGMQFVAGTNHAHGIVNGVEIKHNQIAGILCNAVQNGEFFEGIYLSYGKLIIRNSNGLYFDDIMTGNMTIDVTGTTGVNKIGKLVKRNNGITIDNSETLTILETVQLY